MRLRLGFFSAIVFLEVFFVSHKFVAPASHAPYTFNDLLAFVAKTEQKLRYDDVQVILGKLRFENCTGNNRKEDCNRCLSSGDLGLNSTSVLNSTQFNAKSMKIVYYLMPEKTSGNITTTTCASKGIPSLPSKLFETLVYNHTHGKASSITEHALEHILNDVNKTLGPHLNKKKCFSAENIIEEVKKDGSDHEHEHSGNETGLDEDEFQKACAVIVYRLIQGYCIVQHQKHSDLPTPSFFIDDLFKTKSYLNEEDLKAITKQLGIAKETQSNNADDGNHGHSHRRRRRAVAEPTKAPTPHNATCFSLDSLLDIFSIDHSVGASKSSFKELCPALIQQVQSGSCTAKKTQKSNDMDPSKTWGYGFLAVTIISLVSLLGVATIPFVGKSMYKKVLALLVALAVGTLAGDATLHLIPHALGLHQHKEEEVDAHSEDMSKSFLWKAVVVLASVYVFYLFEVLMHFGLKNKHTHSHVDLELPGPSSRHMSYKKKKSCSNFEHHEGTPQNFGHSDEKVPESNGDIVLTNVHAKTDEGVNHATPKKPPLSKKISSLKQNLSRRSVFSDEHHEKNEEGISAVAWMIIIGDTIHNISDGLAIGAAFSEGGSSGISGGISTSIAVFCHELPHELGDFAVLLTAGMSVKKALLANFLSACSCYIGLVIGIVIGQQMEMRLWIFAIAGGMFLYVALVDMLPDLMHSESLQTNTVITFLLQNIGMILGMTIMLLIAYFEEAIMNAVKIG